MALSPRGRWKEWVRVCVYMVRRIQWPRKPVLTSIASSRAACIAAARSVMGTESSSTSGWAALRHRDTSMWKRGQRSNLRTKSEAINRSAREKPRTIAPGSSERARTKPLRVRCRYMRRANATFDHSETRCAFATITPVIAAVGILSHSMSTTRMRAVTRSTPPRR
eukprot:scaffold117231_cov32-Tisochrysis_lutea.AAC.3